METLRKENQFLKVHPLFRSNSNVTEKLNTEMYIEKIKSPFSYFPNELLFLIVGRHTYMQKCQSLCSYFINLLELRRTILKCHIHFLNCEFLIILSLFCRWWSWYGCSQLYDIPEKLKL